MTNSESLDVATMILNGQINTRILAACRDLQIPAVGISGVDAGLIRAHKRPPVTGTDGQSVDYGFVGDIDAVDADILRKQLDNGLMPVVSPLSCDESGTLLNINADTVAAAIAAEHGAEKLILMTGAAGVLEDVNDPQSLISYIDRAALDKLRDDGKLADGMLPKAAAIDSAIANGVQRVHVISSKLSDSILLEVFTPEGIGTMITGVNALYNGSGNSDGRFTVTLQPRLVKGPDDEARRLEGPVGYEACRRDARDTRRGPAAVGGARRGHRGGAEPHRLAHPLPPGDRIQRQADGLRGGNRGEEEAARDREGLAIRCPA